MELISTVVSSLFTWNNLLFINIGLAAGIMVGALPGLNSAIGVALLLPLTYGMDATTGVLLLLGAQELRLRQLHCWMGILWLKRTCRYCVGRGTESIDFWRNL